jgi:catechol 2,3-dioxygenase-like lactoylglutathione lyase family enzyme
MLMGSLHLEVVQPYAAPPGTNVNRDFLDRNGEGVSHITFNVDDVEREEAKLLEKGAQIILSAKRGGRLVENYQDTRQFGNVIVSLRPPVGDAEIDWKASIERSNWELHHVGLVVRSLDKTLEYYQYLGLVSSLLESPVGRPPSTYEVFGKTRGLPYLPSKVRIFRMGSLSIEVIQPAEGSSNPNAEFLANKGEGISHFAFWVDDLEAETAKLAEKGIQVVLAGRQGKQTTMRYLDTRQFGNIMLELLQKNSMGK